MYSQKVTDRVLDDFAARNGWRPVEHSVDQVMEVCEYIDSLVAVDKMQTRSYIDFKPGLRLTQRQKKEIKRWVENEQFMCFASSAYWETRYGYLCDVSNNIYKFKNRKSQEIFDQVIEEYDEERVAIELFCLKSRQVGISSKVVLKFLHRLQFIPHTQAVMASVNATNAEYLLRMLNVCRERQPFWLVPAQSSTKATLPEWENGSVASIQSGHQAIGIAQGWSPSCIHISELADIPRPKKVLEEGLFPACHSTSKLFFVMEGTGGEATSWQADKWRYYKDRFKKGGRFTPVFISWPCASDIYPHVDWIRKNPIPGGWVPREETKRMKHRAELYIRSMPYLAKAMGKNWVMPPEQMWLWETKYEEAVKSHTLKTFFSQFPVSDDEALQSKNDRAISDEVIADVTSRADREYEVYAVTGQSVLIGQNDEPYKPDSESIDYDKPIIPVSWKSKSGQMNYWELIPLKAFDESDDVQCFNKLLIFRHPEEGENYAIGIDTADGLGNVDEDRSVCEVVLSRKGNQRDIQVAEFVSNMVNPPQMVSIAACMGAYYGQWREGVAGTKDPRGAKFIIEQRERYGDDCQFQLKLMGFYWHHLFVRYDDKHVDINKSNKQGWFSNVWSRPMLLNRFQDAINGGWVQINSPISRRQLASWVRKLSASGKSRLDHESGQHDDCIMALAMAYFTSHADDVLVSRAQLKYANPEEKLPPVSMEWLENTVTI